MIELRDYQKKLLTEVSSELADPASRIMMQLPTGGGKTRIAGQLLAGWLKDGRKAVWLTHRRELASQTEGMLREAGVSASSNIQWAPHTNPPLIVDGVVVLMAQTVSRRNTMTNVWDGYDRGDLMIIDEAHHASAAGWARAIDQWPGPVVGMTATPWRLSEREGFDHLFQVLHCGPQVAALQSDKWLCRARVLSPPEEDRILGGQVESTGDYSESGIELANQDRDVWTAGALRFWQENGENRQTLVYAVSVRHAHNLVATFNDAGIPAGLVLGDTPTGERAGLIGRFHNGLLKALINVAVATEGFDLPDAACVLLTRPTMSLSLYLQMVGRGLRPKKDDGDCVVLDLAGNSLRHGLPEEEREWSLQPRGEPPLGDAVLVRCPHCEGISAAASHQCIHCGLSFGEPCDRCGAWRAWKRWTRKTTCGPDHEQVCDLCHYDAHIQARLPVTEDLKELAMLADDDELSPHRDPFLKNFLEEERRRVRGAAEERKEELRVFIRARESELADDNELGKLFEHHIVTLPAAERPQSDPQKHRLYVNWEDDLRRELADWKAELTRSEAQTFDGQLVYDNARERLLALFRLEGIAANLIPPISGTGPAKGIELRGYETKGEEGIWLGLNQLEGMAKSGKRLKFIALQPPEGPGEPINSGADLLVKVAEWLIRKHAMPTLYQSKVLGNNSNAYLVNMIPEQRSGAPFHAHRRLSNGSYLDTNFSIQKKVELCVGLLRSHHSDPSEFQVLLDG